MGAVPNTAAISSGGSGGHFPELLFIFHKSLRKSHLKNEAALKKIIKFPVNLSSSFVNILRSKLIVYNTNYFMMCTETFFFL